MMVTFISQCEKKALKKTRRVLDAFADRIGDNTWQTVITEEGLNTVKKMLRQTASKSTAVSCRWIRSRSRSQFLWVVGNKSKFDERGIVPVNFTENEIRQYADNYQWNMLSVIQYAAAIAGMFHDFGKATVLFQKKIDVNQKTKKFEPYRHEWLSLRLFQAFVGNKTDKEWLEALSQVERNQVTECFKDGLDGTVNNNHPLNVLAPFAQLVAWLILTHHKLPIYPKWKEQESSPPTLKDVSEWMDSNFDAVWNSHHCKDADKIERLAENWNFEKGLPYQSMHWRSKICLLASEANAKLRQKQHHETDWLNQHLFTAHIARLCLMLADHCYSAQEGVTEEWRSPNYTVWAKSENTKGFKQQLDEHLIGVAHYAQEIVKSLPRLPSSLDSLDDKEALESNVEKKHKETFGWQDDARKCSTKLAKSTVTNGFFGINMASTGKGKTLANAKIMYAIGQGTGRRRFSVALGLRTLTLQTGREFRKEIKLSEEELAIAVGGTAVKQLFENQQNQQSDNKYEISGSESQDALLEPDLMLDYKGSTSKHSLSKWTNQEKNFDKLVNAPVLVCTIDHLIPATEGTKGGRQIAPMLRLLTSDLVLDEPDDFGLDDLPALCRLVHWAGMLGSRVLLSTATIPPALAYALFQAYQAGWSQYAKANIEGWSGDICCAWFDERENGCSHGLYKDFDDFKKKHEKFVRKRVKHLQALPAKRRAEIIKIECEANKTIAETMADAIQAGSISLHQDHCLDRERKTLSIGLVRMANIDRLVAVSKALLKLNAPEDTSIQYCIYHSHYPLAIRSSIENRLDRLLNRKQPETIWQEPEIQQATQKHPESKDYIFIVLASPVAEVGRDHDYDWAIAEPSSMRSIIQLAGRVLRHREQAPAKPNILLLSKNYKALASKPVCFERPGFESKKLIMESHDLFKVLDEEQYREITAIQRITLSASYRSNENGAYQNLIELEHKALHGRLFDKETGARLWWEKHPHWCGEVQRQQGFRDSKKDEAYFLWLDNEDSKPIWKLKNENVTPPDFGEPLSKINLLEQDECGAGIDFWFKQDALAVYQQLAADFGLDLKEISRRFGEVRLTEYGDTVQEYNYEPGMGVYQDIGSE
jgi:CRISPR-associated endonuclease/helicase Cas3